MTGFERRVRALIDAAGAQCAVVRRPLDPADVNHRFHINPHARFHAASTMKVAVMAALYREARDGRLDLDSPLAIRNQFVSIAGGTSFELSPDDDSDAALYGCVGSMATARALCARMIQVSSNLATNNLVDLIGVPAIRSTLDELGAPGLQVLRGVEDGRAFYRGMNNTTDAASLAELLCRMGRGEAIDREASAEMVALLAQQQHKDGIAAGLPPGTRVAHKPGWTSDVHHDAGIVYDAEPYVLVVLTRGLPNRHASAALIADIASEA